MDDAKKIRGARGKTNMGYALVWETYEGKSRAYTSREDVPHTCNASIERGEGKRGESREEKRAAITPTIQWCAISIRPLPSFGPPICGFFYSSMASIYPRD